MKKKYLLFLLFFSGILFNVKLSAQCHVQASICQSGTAGPFIFSTPGSSVGTCLDWIGDSAAYITLYITQGGPLNLLIDGDVNTGFLDVAIFNIPPGVAPCTSILSTSNQLGCNYADYANGCVQFGTAFPCNSSVPAPNVAAGDVIMIVVENWSDGNTSGGAPSNNFTLSLHPNGAQSGMPDLTIIDPGEFCLDDNSTQLMVSHMGGEWSGPGVSSSGMFNPSLAGVGTHTIHYSLGAVPCLATSSIDITVNPLPSVSVGSDVVICYGESTTLTATGSGFGDVEYLWNTGDTTSEIIVSPLITTTYEVLVTDANGCQNTAEVTVTVHPLPLADAGEDVAICIGESTTLLASGGISYLWSIAGGTSNMNTLPTIITTPEMTVSPLVTTTYEVLVTDANGCQNTATVTVTVHPLPLADAGEDVAICIGESTTLSASGGVEYLWSTGDTTSEITVSPLTTTTYEVLVTDANGCENTATVTVTVHPLPLADAGEDVAICIGENITLTATGSGFGDVEYLWNTGDITSEIIVSPLVTTTYEVLVTDANGCQNTATVTVTVHPLPLADAGEDVAICIGESTTLSASGGVEYLWNTGDTTSEITVSPLVTTTYEVLVTDANGCQNTAEVTVTVHPLPLADAGEDVAICIGESTTLLASGGVEYLWNTGDTTSEITVSPLVTTTYEVLVTDANGCENTATVTVTVHPLPLADAGEDVAICIGESTTLLASGGVEYLWNTGDTTSEITVSPLTTTTYEVLVTDANGCENTATVTVTVHPLPLADAGEDVAICIGESTTLSASGGVEYLWNTGDTTSEITVSPLVTTTYEVLVTDANGCQNTAEVTVTVHPLPLADAGEDVAICIGESTTLLASGGVEYLWNTGDTTSEITVSPLVTTTYEVLVTDANGCENTATVTVTVHPLPLADAGEDVAICIGESTTLLASGGVEYLWNTGDTTSEITVSPLTTTTYEVLVTDANGCENTATVTVTVHPLPLADAGEDVAICIGESTTLSASGGVEYLWNTGDITSEIIVSPLVTTTYEVLVTDANGCQNTAEVTVTVHPLPLADAGEDVAICIGESTTLSASGGVEYLWNTGDTTSEITVSPLTTTTYEVLVTDANGCENTATVTVTVHPLPLADAGEDVAICIGESTTLLASGGVEYLWNTGDTTSEITVSPLVTTTYEVLVTDANGCENTAEVTVTVHPLPLADAGEDVAICIGESTTLLASGGVEYLWNTGDTTSEITVSPLVTTTYEVLVTDANRCENAATVTVTVHPLPLADAGEDVAICIGESTTLSASGGVEYLWNTGDTTSEIIVSPLVTTTYEVLVTDANGCENTAEVTVTVNPLITPEFSPVPEMCYGDEIPPLPTISLNGISGSWSPSLNNTVTTEYTFTPDESQSCALQTTLTIIIHEINSENLTALEYCDPNSDGFGIFDLTQVIPIIEGVNTVDVDITFHETEDDALFNANNIEDLNPLTAYPNIDDYNQTIYVRISNDSGCFAVIPLELIVYDLPKITKTISPLEVCDDDYDGSAEFNLTDALSDIMNGLDLSLHTISYHPTQNDARLDENAIGNFANYDSASGSVWVRVEDDQTGCFDVVELALVVNPLPVVSLPEVERYVLCDDDQDGYMVFDLESRIAGIVNGQAGLTVSFHDTYADAESNTAAYEYLHQNNEPTVETVFVRVQTQKGCFVITLMDLVVEPLPVLVPAAEPIAACDGDGDGLGALIDFTATIEQMLNGADPDDYVITLHETYDDAQLDANAIADTTAYMNIHPFTQIVYLRVETILGEGCFNIYPITIQVTASPQLPVAQDGSLPDLAVCDDNQDGITHFDFTGQTQYVLDAQADVSNLEVTYHLNEQNAVEGVLAIATVTHYQNLSNPQTLWVRLENTLTGCFDVAPFDLIVNLPLELPVPPAISLCDEDMDGNVEFDLTIRIPAILANANNPSNFTVEFFTSYADAVAGDLSERIDTPESYWLSTHVHTLGIRVTNNTTGCQSYTIMDIRRLPMPNVTDQPLAAIEGCQDPNSPDGIGTFDLTDREDFIRQGDTNLVITYHLSEEEAQNGTNAIATPDSYTTTSTTIYIRVANPSNAGVSCAVILSVELIIHPLPLIADTAFEVCEVGSTGYAEFYFPDFNADLLGPTQSLDDFNIAYYLSLADAENQTGAINQSVAYSNTQQGSETLWVRVTHLETGCSIIEEVTLYAEEAAQATQPVSNQIFECDYDGVNDGITSGIDLTVYQIEILNGQDPAQFLVAYHTDEYEAHQGLNAVANPSDFTNTVAGGQTIWVRVINSDTNAPCYALATLEVIVEELPNPVITADNDVLCIPFGQSSTADAVVLQSSITQAGYTYAWYHNGSLVAGATQSSLVLDSVGEEGMYSLVVTSPNGCVSDASEEFEVFLSGTPELVNITTTNAFQDQQDIIVTVQGYGEYAYQLNDGPLQDSGHFTNVSPGVHTITVYDISLGNITQLNSCDSLVIDNIQLINYPKFFTPNGDGYNDNWNITGLTEFHNAEIYIFDRYGKLLKQLNPTGEGWDGTFNGNQLPSTDYWFKVLYDEEDQNNNIQRREFKAHFSLKR